MLTDSLGEKRHATALEDFEVKKIAKTAPSASPSCIAGACVTWEKQEKFLVDVNTLCPWVKGESIVIAAPLSKMEADVQTALTNALVGIPSRMHLLDRHTDYSLPPTIGLNSLKPDFVGYSDVNAISVSSAIRIETVGEVKNDYERLATESNMGQVLCYAQALFEVQPLRMFLYAFLANTIHMVLFKFMRGEPCLYTAEMPTTDATKWLRPLLNASAADLGSVTPTNFNLPSNRGLVQICDFLGIGRSAVAFSAHVHRQGYGKETVVVKYFNHTTSDAGKYYFLHSKVPDV